MFDIIFSISFGLFLSGTLLFIFHRTNVFGKVVSAVLVFLALFQKSKIYSCSSECFNGSDLNEIERISKSSLVRREKVEKLLRKVSSSSVSVKNAQESVRDSEDLVKGNKPILKKNKKGIKISSAFSDNSVFPQDVELRKSVISETALALQEESRFFSVSGLLSETVRRFPDVERGFLVNFIVQWVNEEPSVQRVNYENGVTYYEIQLPKTGS